jgi:hypothetical protein
MQGPRLAPLPRESPNTFIHLLHPHLPVLNPVFPQTQILNYNDQSP